MKFFANKEGEKMSAIEHTVDDNISEEEKQQSTSRRNLLKAIAAAGGAIAATTLLPSQWTKPVVKVGVLPVHAQGSAGQLTPTPTPTATAIPQPLATIISCTALNANGNVTIGPTDTITTSAQILPTTAGITLRRSISLNQSGHPDHGVIRTDVALTNASGIFHAPDYDLSSLSLPISPGVDRIIVLWDFPDPTEGTGTCSRNIEIV